MACSGGDRSVLRDLLTIVASIVILVLTVALVGPWFVNWTAQRGWVESELSRIVGARVRVGGDIDLKLLPDSPPGTAGRAAGEFARGRSVARCRERQAGTRRRLAAARRIALHGRGSGAPATHRVAAGRRRHRAAAHAEFRALGRADRAAGHARRVRSRFAASGKSPTIIGLLDFTGEASSLVGPFKGSGQLRRGRGAGQISLHHRPDRRRPDAREDHRGRKRLCAARRS